VLACKTIGSENRRLCTAGASSKSTATGVVKEPESAHKSPAERQAWVETAKAIGDLVRDSSCVEASK